MLDGLDVRGAPAFLASVTNADEALTALAHGAVVIDAKDPAQGALGALPPAVVSSIVRAVAGRAPVSATIGDLPAEAHVMVAAARATAQAGAEIVKAGFFETQGAEAAIAALGAANLGAARLAAVLMADRIPALDLIPHLARAGFSVVMLDTADKAAGSLAQLMPAAALAAFVSSAHVHGLRAGLAGSLRIEDIARLMPLAPDFLGFRGALCGRGRASRIEANRVAAVRASIDAARELIGTSARPGTKEARA